MTNTTDTDGCAIFGRENAEGNVTLLYVEDGSAVTCLPGCWPVGSELGGSYEHPEGIAITRSDAEALGIDIEGGSR